MKLKLDDKGAVVVQDGKPVYTHEDGKDVPFDAAGTLATISRLNGEAKSHRERAEKAEGDLKKFEGITDVDAAKKALETVKNLDDKKLVDAGKVEEVKAGVIKTYEAKLDEQKKAYEGKLTEASTKTTTLEQQLHSEKIGGGFARSKLITDDKHPMRLNIPADMAEARFGKNFKIEDGKAVGYDNAGNKIFSRARPGELADFDEAFEVLVDQYPQKANILKGTGASGGGANPGGGGGNGGKKTYTRAQFDALPPADRVKASKEGIQLTD